MCMCVLYILYVYMSVCIVHIYTAVYFCMRVHMYVCVYIHTPSMDSVCLENPH